MSNSKVVEITNFRLLPGVSDTALTDAAAALDAYLSRSGGMISRTLSRDENGNWTDYVIWQDLPSAQRAMQGFETAPESAQIMPLIDPSSVAMRHDAIHLSH